MADDSPLHLDE